MYDFQWIQWIEKKSKSGMVTKDTSYLIKDAFLYVVVEEISITIYVDIYLVWWVAKYISKR